jgi:hypothetical protein
MRLDHLTIALRRRTAWEATDLGIALVRAHAARIYAVWMLVTLPTFALMNALGWLSGQVWLAGVAVWWLKPVFDRIVVFVISRAVFGDVPSWRETLRAQRSWGWRAIVPWLLWRRFHPGRAMLLPVDLLEGSRGTQRSERVRVLGRGSGSPNMMLTFIGVNLEAMLLIALVLLALMFVPVEFLSDSAKLLWQTLFENPPWWARVLLNLCAWIAMTIVEPFYIGAGFGLYLNRRTQLEGWDIELAFRRIAARLAPNLALLVLFAAFALPLRAGEPVSDNAAPAPAQTATDASKAPADAAPADAKSDDDAGCKCKPVVEQTTLQTMFADSYRDDGKNFEDAVAEAYKGEDLNPKTRMFVWKPRNPEVKQEATEMPEWAKVLGAVMAFLFKYALWIALAVALVVVLFHIKRWMPWITDRFAPARRFDAIAIQDVAVVEALPGDIPAAVRALLREGQVRAALALLYRAAVARLADALGTPLPPGATESECLRRARKLHDAHYAALFARIVRGWQAAAYAQRIPPASEIEAMLVDWNTPQEARA